MLPSLILMKKAYDICVREKSEKCHIYRRGEKLHKIITSNNKHAKLINVSSVSHTTIRIRIRKKFVYIFCGEYPIKHRPNTPFETM